MKEYLWPEPRAGVRTTFAPTPPPILASCPCVARASGPQLRHRPRRGRSLQLWLPIPSLTHFLSPALVFILALFRCSCVCMSPLIGMWASWEWKAACVSFTSVTPMPTIALAQSSVQFSRSVVSDSLWPHGLQHDRLPCPSTPGVYSDSCPSNHLILCHPLLLPSIIRVFSNESGGQSIGVSASASVIPVNIQDYK